ncbi:hypothetical protein H257_09960 [Aphanomyces astaci]|uniref:Uncharacterized protein n=1 Tax=Aphanomyces astaci TaxID=112090 RepID=W4G8I6_APHAT|nr:hypothetical protein H257_09960 [Aphanomyces astaci]ETV76012.1 hypothetical protein H257_09960 [Aphanomyces astaci]|eukprot:XP_009834654.1 hypothetical protein H257_09960 [Aphanomyces astaci]
MTLGEHLFFAFLLLLLHVKQHAGAAHGGAASNHNSRNGATRQGLRRVLRGAAAVRVVLLDGCRGMAIMSRRGRCRVGHGRLGRVGCVRGRGHNGWVRHGRVRRRERGFDWWNRRVVELGGRGFGWVRGRRRIGRRRPGRRVVWRTSVPVPAVLRRRRGWVVVHVAGWNEFVRGADAASGNARRLRHERVAVARAVVASARRWNETVAKALALQRCRPRRRRLHEHARSRRGLGLPQRGSTGPAKRILLLVRRDRFKGVRQE